MGDIEIEVPPIGVKVLKSRDGLDDVKVFHGASYCEAVRLATPGSIDVCKWSPVILGLKRPESKFDKGIGPRMEEPLAGCYIAPITDFRKGSKPDVVIIRGRPEQLRAMTGALGEAALVSKYRGEIGKTALGAGENGWNIKLRLSRGLLRLLATGISCELFDRIYERLEFQGSTRE